MRTTKSVRDGVWACVFSACAVLLIGGMAAWAQGGSGQKPATNKPSQGAPPDARQTGQTLPAPIQIQSNLVTAPVAVIDKKTGEFVYDLKKSDFQILDNGRPQKITGFARESHKIAAVILIQNSDSVSPLLGNLKGLGPIFSQLMLGTKGEAAVITFASEIHVVQGFSSSESELNNTLQSLLPDGNKARLNDALMQAINLLQHRPKGERRVIVAFSSGYDSGSETAKNEIIRRATNAEIEIYGLGLSLSKSYLKRDKQPMNGPDAPENANVTMPAQPGRPSTPGSSMATFGVTVPVTGAIRPAVRGAQSLLFSNNVDAYAQYTGGVFYSQWSAKALQSHLSRIATDIHSQYLLAYVPDDLSERGFHRLEVKVSKHGVRVRTRKGYFYEGQAQ